MERSGSQKFLLVVSIISIIVSLFIILTGIMVNLGGGLLAASPDADRIASEVSAESGMAVSGGQVGFLANFGGMIMIIYGALELIMGILGVRAANDNQKIMPVWILAIASLVFGLVGFIMSLVQGGLNVNSILQNVASIAISALMFWVANNIKVQAGK